MSKHFPLSVLQRKHQLASEASQSEAFSSPVKRGTPATPERETGGSFEQAYPKQPFSELVRLGVAFAGLIGAWRRRVTAPADGARAPR